VHLPELLQYLLGGGALAEDVFGPQISERGVEPAVEGLDFVFAIPVSAFVLAEHVGLLADDARAEEQQVLGRQLQLPVDGRVQDVVQVVVVCRLALLKTLLGPGQLAPQLPVLHYQLGHSGTVSVLLLRSGLGSGSFSRNGRRSENSFRVFLLEVEHLLHLFFVVLDELSSAIAQVLFLLEDLLDGSCLVVVQQGQSLSQQTVLLPQLLYCPLYLSRGATVSNTALTYVLLSEGLLQLAELLLEQGKLLPGIGEAGAQAEVLVDEQFSVEPVLVGLLPQLHDMWWWEEQGGFISQFAFLWEDSSSPKRVACFISQNIIGKDA
jgi:hypothetical protein